jgi:hypothetical protein
MGGYMKNNIALAVAISIFIFAFAINFAFADVTGAGATTNTQIINQVRRHPRQQTTLLQTITIPIRGTRVQYHLHLLQASQRCRKICVL